MLITSVNESILSMIYDILKDIQAHITHWQLACHDWSFFIEHYTTTHTHTHTCKCSLLTSPSRIRKRCKKKGKVLRIWIEQGLTSPPTQYRLSGRQFYRSKDPTNSIKVLKGKVSQPQTGRGSKPTRRFPPCYKWTSEKKKNPITVGRTQRDKAPHSRLACTSPV